MMHESGSIISLHSSSHKKRREFKVLFNFHVFPSDCKVLDSALKMLRGCSPSAVTGSSS